MPDPIVQAARELLNDSLDGMREAIAGAGPEALNWRPAGDDTNTLAVLVAHAIHSTRWWLSIALGASIPDRDRPSEFETTADSANELVSFFDQMAADCRSLLDTDAPFDAGASRTAPSSSRGGKGRPETVTAAWALLHALEHLREHVAHAQLTRQLWDQTKT